MSRFWDEWSWLFGIIFISSLVIGAVVLLNYQLELHSCIAKTAEIGFPQKYDFWGGCRILVENRWIPLDNWYFKTQ